MSRTNDLGRDEISRLVVGHSNYAGTAGKCFIFHCRPHVYRYRCGRSGTGRCRYLLTDRYSASVLWFHGRSGRGTCYGYENGKRQKKEARQVLNNGFLMLLILSAVLTSLFLLSKNSLLMWFGASETTFSYANTYVTIYTAGTFLCINLRRHEQFLIAQGFSGLGMATVVIGAVLNILLDPLFIFVFHMGVAGAAIATVISQIVSTVCLSLAVCSAKGCLCVLDGGDFHLHVMKRIVTFGFSPFLILASDSILLIVLNNVLQRYGGPGVKVIRWSPVQPLYRVIFCSSPCLWAASPWEASR